MTLFKGKDENPDGQDKEPKSTDEIIDEKNLKEKEDEMERGGAENRAKPSDEQTSESIDNVTDEIPPNSERVNLLEDAEKTPKPKPTTTITKKEKIPVRGSTESEPAKIEREKKEEVKKKHNPKSHAFNDDGVCVRCGLGNKADSTTTDCPGRQLSKVTAQKVKDGLVDYVSGTWMKRKSVIETDDEGKDDEAKDDEG